MNSVHAFTLLAMFTGAFAPSWSRAQESAKPALEHARTEFDFTARAPYEEVFPLFGAYEERKWAKGFDPQFLHPSPAHDQQGMVFTWNEDGTSNTWINTAFDVATGHVQYVYVVNDKMITLIDIHLARSGSKETRVTVAYERTALHSEGNQLVTQHAAADRNKDKEWDEMINGYLRKAAGDKSAK